MQPMMFKCGNCREGWNDDTRPCFNCGASLNYRIPVSKIIAQQNIPASSKFADQQTFYHQIFGVKFDNSNIRVPPYLKGYDWAIAIIKDLTLNKIIKVCKAHFSVNSYYKDFDKEIVYNELRPQNNYIVRFRNRIEADKELRKFSANWLRKQGINCNTFKERLILELYYHWKTRGHLDIQNITLCADSRDIDGFVPLIYWRNDKLYIFRCSPGTANPRLSSRAVVS